MESLIVRFAEKDDLETVMRFDSMDDHSFFKPPPAINFYESLIHQQSVLLACCDDDKVIASLRWDFLWPERVPLLSWLYVLPEYRNMRIGEKLLFVARRNIRQMGYDRILLSACDERPEMIAMMRNNRMMEAGSIKFPDGSNEFFFWLPI